MQELTILSRDVDAYQDCIAREPIKGLRVIQATSTPSEIDVSRVTVLLSEPDLAASIVDNCEYLQWLQSTWAGNAPLIERANRSYILTGVKGIFSTAIKEYVAAYILHFSRAIDAFHPRANSLNSVTMPSWQSPQLSSLKGKTLGVLGTGSLGNSLIDLARFFEMRLIGLNRSGDPISGFDAVYPTAQRLSFAQSLDFVVNLMPETPQTQHIIDSAFLAALPAQAVLINAGRGSAIDNDALIDSLNSGQLKAAVLDVFEQEPLPSSHPFWQHPKIWVTHHTAAISDPKAVFAVFQHNLNRWFKSEALDYIIDFNKGY